jgi:hypothetical protein
MSDCFRLKAVQQVLEVVMLVLIKGNIMKHAFEIYSEVMIHLLSLIKRLVLVVESCYGGYSDIEEYKQQSGLISLIFLF